MYKNKPRTIYVCVVYALHRFLVSLGEGLISK